MKSVTSRTATSGFQKLMTELRAIFALSAVRIMENQMDGAA